MPASTIGGCSSSGIEMIRDFSFRLEISGIFHASSRAAEIKSGAWRFIRMTIRTIRDLPFAEFVNSALLGLFPAQTGTFAGRVPIWTTRVRSVQEISRHPRSAPMYALQTRRRAIARRREEFHAGFAEDNRRKRGSACGGTNTQSGNRRPGEPGEVCFPARNPFPERDYSQPSLSSERRSAWLLIPLPSIPGLG